MTTGLDVAVLRTGAVLTPVLLTAALWLAGAGPRCRGAAALATLWNLVGLLVVNALAVAAGAWTFGTTGAMWAGVPVDVVFGWALLWGAVPILLTPWLHPALCAAILVVFDALVMGSLAPLVHLAPSWWLGEISAVALCLVPGVLLGVLTDRGVWLRARVVMQVVLFAAIAGFLLPTIAFAATGRSWAAVRADFGGPVDLVLVQLAALPAVVALAAVAAFARAGGTPYPWDPPPRLVTDTFSFDAYAAIFTNPETMRFFLNSYIVAGSVTVLGQDLMTLSTTARSQVERRFGVLFQRGALFCGVPGAGAVERQHLQTLQYRLQVAQATGSGCRWQPLEAVAQLVFDDGRDADLIRRQRLQTGHHRRITAQVIADGVGIEDQHGLASRPDARYVGRQAFGAIAFAQREIRDAAGGAEEGFWPLLVGVVADQFGHPAAFGQAAGLRRRVHQRLCGVIQVQGDLRHGGLRQVAYKLKYMCPGRDVQPGGWPMRRLASRPGPACGERIGARGAPAWGACPAR